MNYPVTDEYVADRLYVAYEAMPVGSVGRESILELARYFRLRDNFAALSMRDQEKVAELAAFFVERAEEARRFSEMRRKAGERAQYDEEQKETT